MKWGRIAFGLAGVELVAGLLISGSASAATGSGTWQSPVHLLDDGRFVAVSCASSDFCAAFDLFGKAYLFEGGAWSRPVSVHGSGFGSVSCLSDTFCMAVDSQGDAETFDGTGWSSPRRVPGADDLTALACASSQICIAGDEHGLVYLFGKAGWGRGQSIGIASEVQAVSCVSPTFCMAATTSSSAVYDGATWSTPERADSRAIEDLSCRSTSFCLAVDQQSRYVVYRNGVWSRRIKLERRDNSTLGLSCGSAGVCTVVDTTGRALAWDGHGFGKPQTIDPNQQPDGGYAAISCSGGSFCMAVNWAGDAVEHT